MISCPGQSQWTESLLILLLMVEMIAGCPAKCICASDLISCTNISLKELPGSLPATSTSLDFSHNCISLLHNNWLSRIPHLHTLRLGHNQVRWLPARAFHNATQLRHLDLSSNQLQSIHEELFLHLCSLEELLLYNNHIAYVEVGAFAHLGNIQKIYLSWNNLSSFSFSSMQNLTNPHLRTLDLSSNRFVELPVEDVSSLPGFIKSGLYLHNNPLTCSCALYTLFMGWKHRSFPSVMDFSREHTCLYMGKHRALVRFLESQNGFSNCSVGLGHDTGLKVLVGRRIMVTCNTSLPQENTTYLWISPAYDFIFPPGNSNQSFKVHPNGSLEIQRAQPWNSGVYMCIAVNRRLSYNATHEVNVTVRFPKPEESFNTGLTTLLGCVVSLVLVFIYLYMTPCRCFPCCSKPPQTPSPPQESSAQSSILCGTPPASEGPNGRKAAASRHVVFLEPIKERRAGKSPKTLQPRSDSDSASSVFSDFPIVQT